MVRGAYVDSHIREVVPPTIQSGFTSCPATSRRLFHLLYTFAHPKRLELAVRVAVPRLREYPTTTRRRFCLPYTLVGLIGALMCERPYKVKPSRRWTKPSTVGLPFPRGKWNPQRTVSIAARHLFRGRRMVNATPCPSPSLLTVVVLPCASTIARVMANLRPVPPIPRLRDWSVR